MDDLEELIRSLKTKAAMGSYMGQEIAQQFSYATRKNCQMEREKLMKQIELEKLMKQREQENKASCTRSLKPLLSAMKDFPSELMQRMIPVDRAIMLVEVSKEMRAAMGRVKPAARVQAKQAMPQPAGEGEAKTTSEGGSMASARAPETAVIEQIALLERGLGKLQARGVVPRHDAQPVCNYGRS